MLSKFSFGFYECAAVGSRPDRLAHRKLPLQAESVTQKLGSAALISLESQRKPVRHLLRQERNQTQKRRRNRSKIKQAKHSKFLAEQRRRQNRRSAVASITSRAMMALLTTKRSTGRTRAVSGTRGASAGAGAGARATSAKGAPTPEPGDSGEYTPTYKPTVEPQPTYRPTTQRR